MLLNHILFLYSFRCQIVHKIGSVQQCDWIYCRKRRGCQPANSSLLNYSANQACLSNCLATEGLFHEPAVQMNIISEMGKDTTGLENETIWESSL